MNPKQVPLPMRLPNKTSVPIWVAVLDCRSADESWQSRHKVARLATRLRTMVYDDAWQAGAWRLEYLWLAQGYPHYRLFYRGQVLGQVDVRCSTSLWCVQQRLAVWLSLMNFQQGVIVSQGAKTKLAANTTRVVRLFTVAKGATQS